MRSPLSQVNGLTLFQVGGWSNCSTLGPRFLFIHSQTYLVLVRRSRMKDLRGWSHSLSMKKKDAAKIASCVGNADFRRRSGHRSSSGCARVCINHVVTGQALCLAEYRNEIRARASRLTCRADKPRTSSSSGELTCYVWRADRLSRNPIRIRHKTDTDRGGGGKCRTDGNVRDVRTQREREPSCCTGSVPTATVSYKHCARRRSIQMLFRL